LPIWQVIIAQNELKELLVKDLIFSGIPFYQTELADYKRKVKCHERKSIYKIAFECIEKNFS
jgi:hypothetical protein